jgi:uncharacterized protein
MRKSMSMSKKSGSKVGVVTKTAGDLRNAAGQGNVAEVHAILDNNPDLLDEPDSSYRGRTALMQAADHDHLPIAELSLNRGCAIDKQGKYGGTALIIAAHYGHLPIAELLLNRGCAIDIQDQWGCTALMCAARYGQTDVARVLLVRGADLTLMGTFFCGSRDALRHANDGGHTAIVELIEREGCWRRRRNWMLFSSMFKDSLRTSTAPIDSSSVVVHNALAMDEITRFIAKML